MTQIPRFNLSKAKIKTQAELDAAESAAKAPGSKYLREGLHDVTIVAATYEGKASDDNWGKFLLKMEGLQGKTTSAMLLVPLEDVQYRTSSGKVTTFLFTKFKRFMDAIGVKVTVDTLEDTLKTYFSDVSKTLVGTQVNIKLDYDNNHVKYLGKDEAGIVQFGIQMKDGSMIAGTNGKPLTFPDRDSALGHAESNQITIQDYASVLDYTAVAGQAKKTVGGSW
jgi:hypothetical protein